MTDALLTREAAVAQDAGGGAGAVAAEARDEGPRLTPDQESRVQRLEARLKCPVCRTQSVLESTSFMALEMRAKIRELVAAGRSDRQVLDYFVERYGDYILLEPRKRGFGISAYALPVAAVLVGAALLFLGIGRRRDTAVAAVIGAAAPGTPDTSRTDLARVDEELRRYTR